MNNKASQALKSSAKRKKQRKKADSHSMTDRYKILDERITVFRTTKSGLYWSMSCWLKEEGKAYRRSLRTKNKDEATELATDQYFKLLANIQSGNKIFAITAKELVADFIKFKANEAKSHIITEGRVSTITTSLNKWFLQFVGENTKLDKINRHDFEEYYVWRRQKASDVRNATLINERALISSLFKWGIARGYFRYDQMPIFSRLNVKKSQLERRDALDLDEWRLMYSCFPRWIKKAANEQEEIERKFVRDFITASVNTGLRFGEMRKLKWSMINLKPTQEKYKDGSPIINVAISVPPDTKTGARIAVGSRGDVFKRIKIYSDHTKANDWVFANNKTGEQLSKKVLYKHWDSLLKESRLALHGKKFTYYSLRHTYITFRILTGANAFILANNAGTSVRMIEKHYAHVRSEETIRELTKQIKRDSAGQFLLG